MKVTLKNRIHILLRERGIRSAAEFARRLQKEGYSLSTSQATRYVREVTPAFDVNFANAACNVLQCLPSDLYDIRVDLDAGEDLDPLLAIPRHASVLRTAPGQGPVANTVPPKAERADDNAPNKGAIQKAEVSVHTGPSAPIFPFPKK